jgi:hypothetical protein
MVRLDPSDGRGRSRTRQPRSSRWLAPVLLPVLLLPACASAPALDPPGAARAPDSPTFVLERDVFAFPNLVRAESPDRTVDFANYCLVMARGASQFFRFARFDAAATPVTDAEYTRLTAEVMRLPAWHGPWPAARRIVIPGYADLHALSRAREAAVKAGFDSSFLSMLHWRTWRVALPLSARHQAGLAQELMDELQAGRPVPLMLSSFPVEDYLNHAVLVYHRRPGGRAVEFLAYDPNDPTSPLGLHFDPASRGFWVEPLPYGPPGRVRAFRIYASPFL